MISRTPNSCQLGLLPRPRVARSRWRAPSECRQPTTRFRPALARRRTSVPPARPRRASIHPRPAPPRARPPRRRRGRAGRVPRTLPFTWTGSSITSSTARASSHAGQGSYASDAAGRDAPTAPRDVRREPARRAGPAPAPASRGIAERRARWFTKTMRAEMAVLKANASMSVLTFLDGLVEQPARGVVHRVTRGWRTDRVEPVAEAPTPGSARSATLHGLERPHEHL